MRWTSKWISSPVFPAACKLCGKLSYAPGSQSGILLVVSIILFSIAGLAASFWHSPIPLLVWFVLAIVLWAGRLHVQPMLGLPPLQVAQARTAEGLGWLLALLYVFMQ